MNSFEEFVQSTLKQIEHAETVSNTLGFVLRSPALIRKGLWLEFGCYTGGTMARIAAVRGEAKVFGFDSFKGLPEDWRPNEGLGKGAFAVAQAPTPPEGAEYVVGLFEDTLPKFNFNDMITLVHIDCDIYSAARVALKTTLPHMMPGTIVVFDELLGYEGYEKHEMLALYETWRDGLKFRWLCKQGLPWNYSAALIVV